MKTIAEQYNDITEIGGYLEGTEMIANYLGLTMKVKHHDFGKHFEGDKTNRHIFKVTLKKDGKQFTFKFGQSINARSEEPNLYDVLSCLQKYEVGTFNDFCENFGYDEDSRASKKIYKAVLKEYANMEKLFSSDELELLQEIQ